MHDLTTTRLDMLRDTASDIRFYWPENSLIAGQYGELMGNCGVFEDGDEHLLVDSDGYILTYEEADWWLDYARAMWAIDVLADEQPDVTSTEEFTTYAASNDCGPAAYGMLSCFDLTDVSDEIKSIVESAWHL